MNKVRAVVEQIKKETYWGCGCCTAPDDDENNTAIMTRLIDAAITEERVACARIADAHARHLLEETGHVGDCAPLIARDIRLRGVETR